MNIEIKIWQNHKGPILDSVKGFDVIECQVCGYTHIVPLQDKKEYANYYEEEFYLSQTDYIKNHTEDLDWWSIEHNEKYDLFDELLSECDTNKRILDIGSGPGYFLKVGKDRGWDVKGIEPGKPAYIFATEKLGLNVINDFFSSKNYRDFGLFNVVHMNNVLEHVHEPKALLSLAYEIVESGGVICITVPNDYNPLQKVVVDHLEKEPWWVVPKDHINYFNCNSLSRLIEEAGFKIVYTTASFPLEFFLLMGDDYVGNGPLGREIHGKRKKFDLAMAESGNNRLKRQIYNKLSEIGLGREITVFGKKR